MTPAPASPGRVRHRHPRPRPWRKRGRPLSPRPAAATAEGSLLPAGRLASSSRAATTEAPSSWAATAVFPPAVVSRRLPPARRRDEPSPSQWPSPPRRGVFVRCSRDCNEGARKPHLCLSQIYFHTSLRVFLSPLPHTPRSRRANTTGGVVREHNRQQAASPLSRRSTIGVARGCDLRRAALDVVECGLVRRRGRLNIAARKDGRERENQSPCIVGVMMCCSCSLWL